MSQPELIEKVAALIHETGEAHHHKYRETDGVDPDWPLFYANYLHDKLPELIGTKLTKSEIIYLLQAMEADRLKNAPSAKWPPYYARLLVQRYTG